MTEQWERINEASAYSRLDTRTEREAVLLRTEGGWELRFVDAVKGTGFYNIVELGAHATPELAMAAADGAIEQAHETILRSITHHRLPIPHKRLQVARFNDGSRPTFYVYDHVIDDSLRGIETKDMDCRLGCVPNQERVDKFMYGLFANQELPPEELDHDLEGPSIGD